MTETEKMDNINPMDVDTTTDFETECSSNQIQILLPLYLVIEWQ